MAVGAKNAESGTKRRWKLSGCYARLDARGAHSEWIKESMAVSLYNGKLYLGTLPLAQVYRYDGPNELTLVGRLDHTPHVVYRRAWSMAVDGGRLYCGVLPAGHVLRLEAGKSVTND